MSARVVDPAEVTIFVERIRQILAGQPPELQGAALADLLAIWLAGHVVNGNAQATRKLRAELLAMHCRTVRKLVKSNAMIIGTLV